MDSPAETATAAAATKNADTAAANSTNTAAHDARADANASRLADLQAARDAADEALKKAELDYNNRKLAADTDYQNGKLSQDQWIAERNAAHQEAQDAVAAADSANRKYEAEQTAQYQRGVLANQTAQNTETARSNKAREANDAATLLERQQADQQASADRQMQTGAGLLQQHAQEATGALNNWVNAAAGNKNFGLGGPIPANMAAGLMGDANSFATQAIGGQSILDRASQLVHQANPALANTPAGAGYAAIAAQMLERAGQQQMQAPNPSAPAAASTSNSNVATQLGNPSNSTALSPSDPRFLGTLIGHAATAVLNNSQLSPDTQFSLSPASPSTLNNSQLSADAQFTAPRSF